MAPKAADSAQSRTADRDRALALVPVSHETAERLDAFVALLLRWQNTQNLIANSTIANLWTRHIADSLQIWSLVPAAKVFVDLGSGGGFPGLPIACALAGVDGAVVHLVESNLKKAAFLREALRATGAPGQVHAVRIEEMGTKAAFAPDIVTARALAPMKELLGLAAPWLEKGAKGVFLKGQDIEVELTEAAKYWKIVATSHVSRTNPDGRIVVVEQIEAL